MHEYEKLATGIITGQISQEDALQLMQGNSNFAKWYKATKLWPRRCAELRFAAV